MSGISVEYIDHFGGDLRVSNAARVSFDNWKDELDDKDVRLINYLARNQHTSPFRHTSLCVRCTAPIFLARQLGKHQVGLEWNEVSRRYVDSWPELYDVEMWRKRPDGGIKQGSGEFLKDDGSVTEAVKHCYCVALDTYQFMLDRGVAPEQARMVLPQSMLTSWIWTGSIQAWAHLYKLRADGHAQKEAQHFAELLSEIVVKHFPHSWEALINE